MSMLTKQGAIVIAATLGVALSGTWAVPAFARTAGSSTAKKSQVTLKPGDLVRPRPGGPLMIVESVQNGQVTASWWRETENGGSYRSSVFPIDRIMGPIAIPPTSPSEKGPNTLPRSVYEWPH
jgi:uncharacterized protein YodC (DUF2158 family)